MKLRDIKKAVSQRYTYWGGQGILLLSSLLFTDEIYASDGWDETSNKSMTDVIHNVKDSASAAKDALSMVTQVAGIAVFMASVYKIYRIKTRHEDTGIGKYIAGVVVGIVLFFAPIFMSVGKNSLVGTGVF